MKTDKYKMTVQKVLIALAITFLPLYTFAQSTFDVFEDMDDVTVVSVNKQLFELMSRVDSSTPEAKQYIDLVKNLDNLRVFATENAGIATQMKTKVEAYLKSAKLTELMRVKDKEGNVKIYIKQGRDADHVSELFMFVDGLSSKIEGDRKPEAVIVSLTGNIDLNKISELTKKMDIPGGEHLKDVEKK